MMSPKPRCRRRNPDLLTKLLKNRIWLKNQQGIFNQIIKNPDMVKQKYRFV